MSRKRQVCEFVYLYVLGSVSPVICFVATVVNLMLLDNNLLKLVSFLVLVP